MSLAASVAQGPGNGRLLFGIAVSLAVHAVFVLAYRDLRPVAPPSDTPEPTAIAITIRPPSPPPPPPAPEPTPRVQPKREQPATPMRTAPPRRVIAVPPAPQRETPADPFVVQQPESAPPPTDTPPKFDMEAAKRIARENAKLRDPAKEGTALAQFPEPPLQAESKLARGIAAAKRRNCKDGLPGGLLAPLYLMMDKKDSGCKW